MPDITSTNFTELSYDVETVPGTTDATPAFQILPTVSGGPLGNTEVISSEVLRSDRQIDDVIAVDRSVEGATTYELSYAPFKPLVLALLQSTSVVTAVSQSDIAMDGDAVPAEYTLTSAALADFSAVPVDSFVKVAGTTTITNGNGIFRVKSATTLVLTLHDDDATVSGTEAAGATVTVDAENGRNGVAVAPSYTFLKKITGIAATTYMYYRGCQISSMSFNFETAAILGGEFNIVGLTEDVTETEIASSTYVNSPAYTLMNSVQNLTIKSAGLGTGAEFQNINLTIDNNINPAKAIGTLGAIDLASFTLNVEGDVTLYFQDKTAHDNFINATSFSIELRANDSSGNTIVIYMPVVKFLSLESPVEGKDNFLFLSGTIKALRDPTNNYTVQITYV